VLREEAMEIENATDVKAERKRGPKKNDISSLLRRIADAATAMAQDAERAAQALRVEGFRGRKNRERLRIVLQQNIGVLDLLKRINLDPGDRQFLVDEGYIRERKDRS
jgi:predicted nucleic acid-binding protein